MRDSHDRNIDYMRISITDRCNLRCTYCMPMGVELFSHDEVLSYDEIVMVCREAVKLGIVKFKITGGEPLVRKDCAKLIKSIYEIDGVRDVTLTTNGVLLKKQLNELIEAGLKSVNISLDSIDRERYQKITGFDSLNDVLESIEAAVKAGLKVKINSVLHDEDYKDDFNKLLEFPKKYKIDLRFIEMMPIGYGSESYLVSNESLLNHIKSIYKGVETEMKPRGNGPAIYYKIEEFEGCVGFISAIHGKFCDKCNRIRMTSTGEVKFCLCFEKHVNIKDAIKAGDTKAINELLKEAILSKPEKHCFEELENVTEFKKMAQIGG
ncbi:MAG: GTP 3',8-cyclase MoaA [Anaerovoracaceae bacterium]